MTLRPRLVTELGAVAGAGDSALFSRAVGRGAGVAVPGDSSLRSRAVRRLAAVAAVLALAAAPGAAAQGPEPPPLAEARALAEAGDPAAAEARYLAILDGGPAELAAPALLGLAEVRLAGGDLAGARDAAERLVGGHPAAPEAARGRLVLARVLAAEAADSESLAAARAAFAAAAAGAPPGAGWALEAAVRGAELDVALGETDRAAAALLEIVDREPPSAWQARAHRALADLLLARGQWSAAADLLAGPLAAAGRYPAAAAPELAALGRRGALLHRLRVRPAAGANPWQAGSTVAGLALKRPAGVAAREDGALAVVDNGPDLALVWADGQVVARRELRRMGRPFWDAGGAPRVPSDDAVVRLDTGERATATSSRVPVRRVHAGAAGPVGLHLIVAQPLRAASFGDDLALVRNLFGVPDGEPEDLAYLPAVGLHVLDAKNRRVLRFPPDGGEGETAVAGLDRPRALAVDLLGDLYVLERGGRIRVFGPDGAEIASLGPELPGGIRLDDPEDLAVDGSGRLYVADPKQTGVVVLE